MILFIDDEEARSRPWVEQLKDDGQAVRALTSADEARQAFESLDSEVKCIVLDLMIPADGEVPDRETGYGTRTGLWLLQRLRDHNNPTPVIVLSNVDDPGVEDAVTKLEGVYQRKRSCGPVKLAALVQDLIA